MKVKRFVALDMRSTLTQIRQELGADAIILSTRTITGGGVEVMVAYNPEQMESTVASLALNPPVLKDKESGREGIRESERENDRESRAQVRTQENRSDVLLKAFSARQFSRQGRELRQALTDSAAKAKPSKASARRQEFAAREPVSGDKPDKPVQEAVPDAGMKAMQAELNSIRNLLEQRLSGLAWDQFTRRTPVQASIWERLNGMGIPGHLSKELLQRLTEQDFPDKACPDKAWRHTLAHLTRSVPVTDTDVVAAGGRFALLGPTGVGKTTTIGKLATRFVLEHGSDSVALVTTDTYRIAAHEQLRALGRILGVSVRIVDRQHDLAMILDELSDKQLVLIDTAGLSPASAEMQQQLQQLQLQTQAPIDKLLVMACTSQGQVLRAAWAAYSTAGLSACILTRLDETAAFGEALALAIEKNLPIAYETFGQAIPEDIRRAQAHRLISRAVGLASEAQLDREQLMNEFGGLYNMPGAAPQLAVMGERSI
ncbi:MAG: flagellar biosynthesis protein FlhF [Pseudomonadales bacterium]|nr:flagellar biosynthesis protein FlhF [Pseudomonadales bacterium]